MPASTRAKVARLREEIANSVSHGVGLLAAAIVVPIIISSAAAHGPRAVVASSAFALTMILVYLTSTLYHALPRGRAKRVFHVLDHSAIFLLIAGTYTPFALGVLAGAWGWTLFGMVWSLAIAGIALKIVGRMRYPRLETILYITMGWLVVIATKPLLTHMEPWGLFWLVAGGVAYTSGVVFYAAEHVRYSHLAWHLLVIVGTSCHVVAVVRYSA